MLIGVIADDFTGASDIANTLAKGVAPEGGLKTAQFSGVPSGGVRGDIEAAVISLKSRTAPVAEAVAQSLAALDWLLAQGCRQIVFKYCSTFDSTSAGNIGPVLEALSKAMGVTNVVACPAFPTAGRTVYQGHLFVFDRLLNESGMQDHPLTPMTDPDLRRVLGHQVSGTVGLVPVSTVAQGALAVRDALKDTSDFVIVDAVSDDDLLTIGKALDGVRLLSGGSGIALGLPRNFLSGGVQNRPDVRRVMSSGRAAILAGSCSGATRGQVELYAASNPSFTVDVPAVMAGEQTAADLVRFITTHDGAPLVYSSGTPASVLDMQTRYGRDAVAHRLDALFAETARLLVRAGYTRIVVAGGETSGAVAQALAHELGVEAMDIGREIDPGVPVLSMGREKPVLVALKSGNFGAPDFFAKALVVMEGAQ